MTVTPDSFRVMLPEFTDSTVYLDPAIQTWITVAGQLVNADRWGDLTDVGVSLVTAHYLALQRENQMAAAAGGVPGRTPGIVSSESVDRLSVSYDVTTGSLDGAGQWNLTMYGAQYAQLSRIFGAGGVQL